ncbi:unnamed protein product [Acanthoscelides obtectus]|uniref:Peptidase S1 domain-containing protein n=1 Tax=Acanthoscelides obtectus TaxID=200917 RepID=A0A9P0QEV1_ACAOB|nr:unnamed protein product [Acanthoscelides obtectus]CAK1689134.1 hypothetical protein AOBTE_LOCUS37029 [Acanthoscelides obtectus]
MQEVETAVNVILGAHQTTKAELDKCQKFKVTSMYVHKNYNQSTLKDDIALLRLETNDRMLGDRLRPARVYGLQRTNAVPEASSSTYR